MPSVESRTRGIRELIIFGFLVVGAVTANILYMDTLVDKSNLSMTTMIEKNNRAMVAMIEKHENSDNHKGNYKPRYLGDSVHKRIEEVEAAFALKQKDIADILNGRFDKLDIDLEKILIKLDASKEDRAILRLDIEMLKVQLNGLVSNYYDKSSGEKY